MDLFPLTVKEVQLVQICCQKIFETVMLQAREQRDRQKHTQTHLYIGRMRFRHTGSIDTVGKYECRQSISQLAGKS